jgi:hypothetical protein
MLATTDLGRLAAGTKTHLVKFTDTITGSAFRDMILVPGSDGHVHILHHGFSCVTPNGPAMIFIQGNLSDCSYFKILPRGPAVEQIKVAGGTRSRTTTKCPTLEDKLGAASPEAFKDSPPPPTQGSLTLHQHPNHLMINPDVFVMANGVLELLTRKTRFHRHNGPTLHYTTF